MRRIKTDILILGSGGAGLFAALHANQKNPKAEITVAVKGLLGKSGCTRMVQGGYNVALAKEDSVERHFMDTIEGGKWLPDQDLAWQLVEVAIERIHELENARSSTGWPSRPGRAASSGWKSTGRSRSSAIAAAMRLPAC